MLDVDKERQTVATGPSLGQLPISFGSQRCPVVETAQGVGERDKVERDGEIFLKA